MTEAEWFAAPEPEAMLEFLRITGRADERRLRLFACACVRRVWHLLTDQRSREAVEVAERHVEGRLHFPSVSKAGREAHAAAGELNQRVAPTQEAEERRLRQVGAMAASAAAAVLQHSSVWELVTAAEVAARQAASASAVAVKLSARARGAAGRPLAKLERCIQCRLLRCLFGNPFRAPPALPASLLKWADGTVVKIATAIYQERRWGDVGILADTLEDAGLAETCVSEHLRGGGPHAKGCFVLDAILGKS